MKVLTIDQMHQLKELGVDVKPKGTCLMYTSDSSDNYYLKYGESTCEDDVVAFGLQDIIELLPKIIVGNTILKLFISVSADDLSYVCGYIDSDLDLRIAFSEESCLLSAFKLVIYCGLKGYLKTK